MGDVYQVCVVDMQERFVPSLWHGRPIMWRSVVKAPPQICRDVLMTCWRAFLPCTIHFPYQTTMKFALHCASVEVLEQFGE